VRCRYKRVRNVVLPEPAMPTTMITVGRFLKVLVLGRGA
jgi:hypothetical protein